MNLGQQDEPQHSETAATPSEVKSDNDMGASMNPRTETVSARELWLSSQSMNTEFAGFERYQIERMLGVGGFGIVYLGFDTILEHPVAIKMPQTKLAKKRPAA